MSRRRRERALDPRAPEPLDKERAAARFHYLAGRSVTLDFFPYGPLVAANTPEELAARVEEGIVAESGRQRQS